MLSNTFSISYQIQTANLKLPVEFLPDALRYVNAALLESLETTFHHQSTTTIDDIISTADLCSDFYNGTDGVIDTSGSCFVAFSNITTSADQLWTLQALQYQIITNLRTEGALRTFDGLFDGNTVTWLGPNLVASPVVLSLHGAPSEMTGVHDTSIFQDESMMFLSQSSEFQRTDSSVDMIILQSQSFTTTTTSSSDSGTNLRGQRRMFMVETNVLALNALVLGESDDIASFQDRVVNSFNRDSGSAFLHQFKDTDNALFFSYVYLVEASKAEVVAPPVTAAPTRKPNSILQPRLPYKTYNFLNATYIAIAMAVLSLSIVVVGVLVIVVVKVKRGRSNSSDAYCMKQNGKMRGEQDPTPPVPCTVTVPDIRVC